MLTVEVFTKSLESELMVRPHDLRVLDPLAERGTTGREAFGYSGADDHFRLFDRTGRFVGFVRAPTEEPIFGRNAPTVYLRRATQS